MSARADKRRADARELRDRLKAEGRHQDAEIIQRLVRSFESSSSTLKVLHADNQDLRLSVIAFGAPWAAIHAKEHGLPDGHLLPTHYDILQRAGARMDDFTRGEER